MVWFRSCLKPIGQNGGGGQTHQCHISFAAILSWADGNRHKRTCRHGRSRQVSHPQVTDLFTNRAYLVVCLSEKIRIELKNIANRRHRSRLYRSQKSRSGGQLVPPRLRLEPWRKTGRLSQAFSWGFNSIDRVRRCCCGTFRARLQTSLTQHYNRISGIRAKLHSLCWKIRPL